MTASNKNNKKKIEEAAPTVKKVQQRTLKSREKINKAGFQLFGEKGYFNTNTKEIAKLAGVSTGNFYNYYKDKGELYTELTRIYVTGSADAVHNLQPLFNDSTDYRKTFESYVSNQIKRCNTMGRFFYDTQVLVLDLPHLAEIYEEAEAQLIKEIEYLIRNIKGAKKRASYPVMARFIYTYVNELSNDMIKVQDSPIFDEYLQQFIAVASNYLFGEGEL